MRLLFRYFRPYWAQGLVALVATMGYAICTVMLVGLFQIILEEVIQTDASVAEASGLEELLPVTEEDGEAGEQGGQQEAGEDESEAPTAGIKASLMTLFQNGYDALRDLLGVEEEQTLYFVPILLICTMMVRSISQFANGYLFQVIGLGATTDLRNDLYDGILNQSSRFYHEHPSGELVSRVGNDIAVMQNAVATRIVDLFQQVPTLFGLIWALFSIHFKMTVLCLFVVPAVAYPIARFGKGMRKTSHKSQERLADLSNLVAEAVRGQRVVKAFGMEDFELQRFRQATQRHLRMRLKAQLLSYASGPVIETIAVIGAGGFLIYAGRAVRSGELTPSLLVTFLITALALYDPIRRLNKVNLSLQEALAATHRVSNILHMPNTIEEREDAVELAPIEREIRFSGIQFSYGDEAVLHGIDLVIPKGQIVALVGRTGAGKSTLVNFLPRFFDPTNGSVSIDGHNLTDVSLESLRSQIGIVTQDTMLFNDTIRNNIAYGRVDLPLERVREAAVAAFADEFIEHQAAGYDTEIGESGQNLSGGQRQRLAIARALLKDPPILILDEATSHLDSEAEASVQQALYNLMEGRTALVIAHRLSTIHRADRILVMDAGKIVEDGDHDSLLRQGGLYKMLYDLQFDPPPESDE